MATGSQVIVKAVAEYPLSWNSLSAGQCSKLNLGKNQIHLWIVQLGGLMVGERLPEYLYEDLYENLYSTTPTISALSGLPFTEILTAADYARARKIVDNDHRKHYLGGKIGLRILLSAYTHIVPADLGFGYGSRGKPSLLNRVTDGKLTFNYTLSGGYALYAFAWNREVGVDLEVLPRTIATSNLAKRILTEGEQTAWNALNKQQQNQAMLACWTRKESYGKVLGVGIRYAMNRVNLFTDLQCARWCTEVSGLFDQTTSHLNSHAKPSPKPLHGVQLGLPIAGVASLMYAECGERAGDEDRGHNPALSVFQGQL